MVFIYFYTITCEVNFLTSKKIFIKLTLLHVLVQNHQSLCKYVKQFYLEGIARTDNKFTNTASTTNYKEQYDMKDWAWKITADSIA